MDDVVRELTVWTVVYTAICVVLVWRAVVLWTR